MMNLPEVISSVCVMLKMTLLSAVLVMGIPKPISVSRNGVEVMEMTLGNGLPVLRWAVLQVMNQCIQIHDTLPHRDQICGACPV
jgi:hypothetical protein